MSKNVVTLDVREDIRHGREPFSRIMRAVAALQTHQILRLIAPFEPAPLFQVLAQQGFSHRARPIDNGDWEVFFSRLEEKPAQASRAVEDSANRAPSAGGPLCIDARGLAPPEPLVRILEALEPSC